MTSRPRATVQIASLVLHGSPRSCGEERGHVQVLAGVEGGLPPILVHRESMRVLDGMHRVRAAVARGDESIEVVYFDGDDREAFVEAVRANVTHGLPLTIADRKAAARRIIDLFPQWSNRRIAAVTGLAATTIGSIREETTGCSGQLNARIGKDGRVRPLDGGDRRRRVAELLAERPGATLREVARAAGVSVATAKDVRRRVTEGRDPVPTGRSSSHLRPAPGSRASGGVGPADPYGASNRWAGEVETIMNNLCRDPSLRYSERGRALIRWLGAHLVRAEDVAMVAHAVPEHCAYSLHELASQCARVWTDIASRLEDRRKDR